MADTELMTSDAARARTSHEEGYEMCGRCRAAGLWAMFVLAIGFDVMAVGEQISSNASRKSVTNAERNIDDLYTAARLIKYGRREGVPEALAVAASIVHDVRISLPRSANDSKARRHENNIEKKSIFDVPQLLEEAKALAKGDVFLISLIDRYESEMGESLTLMGKEGGAIHGLKGIAKRNSNTHHNFLYKGQETAKLIVIGDGSTDLDLYIFDETGREIAVDNDRSDNCIVRWLPSKDQQFKIEIVNLGARKNEYLLFTN